MLVEKQEQIFKQIEPILYAKLYSIKRTNPHIEAEEFKSTVHEILTKLDTRLHTLIIEKTVSGTAKDCFYDPSLHSEEMLLTTVYKYLVKSFSNHQLKKTISARNRNELLVPDYDDINTEPDLFIEINPEKFLNGDVLLKKITQDLISVAEPTVQSATQRHFLKALVHATALAVRDYEVRFVAKIEKGQLDFAKNFYFVLWKEMPRSLALEVPSAENPLVKKSLQKLIDSEQALKKRVSRYFNEYKGGIGRRIMHS